MTTEIILFLITFGFTLAGYRLGRAIQRREDFAAISQSDRNAAAYQSEASLARFERDLLVDNERTKRLLLEDSLAAARRALVVQVARSEGVSWEELRDLR
jgi:hypothetical protein